MVSSPTKAASPKWDLEGPWSGVFVHHSIVFGINMVISSENLTTGDFTGVFDGVSFSGSTLGDSVAFSIPITDFQGTISPEGDSMGGNLQNFGPGGEFTGFWGTSGQARLIGATAAPEPGSLALLGVAALPLVDILRRRKA